MVTFLKSLLKHATGTVNNRHRMDIPSCDKTAGNHYWRFARQNNIDISLRLPPLTSEYATLAIDDP